MRSSYKNIFSRTASILVFSFLLTVVFLLPGCKRCSKEKPPNIIFITVDTLRADHLSGFGYERKTSPYLDSLARQGVVFKGMLSHSSNTAPSMASTFTSLYPDTIGMLSNGEKLSGDVLTMAEILGSNGYQTGCIHTNAYLEKKYGFDQGFQFYKSLYPDTKIEVQRKRLYRADKVNRAALEWMKEREGDKPYFLYLHYMSTHCPYLPPAPYDIRFDPGFDRTLPDFTLVWRYIYGKDRVKITPEYEKIYQETYTDREVLDHMVALYDGEIRYFDDQLKKLLAALRERDLLDNTLVVISSDHGEEFKEHGGLTHGKTVFQEVVHVPLILYFPGRLPEGKEVNTMTRNLDILPTVLDIAGIEPPGHLEGRSLAPLWKKEAATAPETSFAHIEFEGQGTAGMGYAKIEHASVSTNEWRYIRDMLENKDMLFDRKEDPADENNLAEEHPEKVKKFSRQLQHHLNRSQNLKRKLGISDTASPKIDESEKKKLEALGYFNK
ncbi:MAG: sulfatase [bacterium]